MNIALVVQYSTFVTTNTGAATPSGFFYVAAALKEAGHDISWVEFPGKPPTVDEIREAIKQRAAEKKIDVLMCGALFGGWKEFRDICAGAKLADENMLVVGGGGLFTYSPFDAMELCTGCDVGVIGEGEIIAVRLVEALEKGLDLKDVDGIVYREKTAPGEEKGRLTKNKNGEYVHDLDLLPYPLISPEFEKSIIRYKEVSIIGARSCPFSCTFCSLSTTKNYRKRSVGKIVDEIKYYMEKYGVRQFLFMDELFADNVERIQEFIENLRPLNIRFSLQSRITDKLSEEIFRDLAEAGIFNFTLGVENINDSILSSMNKKLDSKTILRCFDNIEKAGCANEFTVGYLMGDPAETIETAATSIKFFRENCYRFKHLAFDLVNPYPGAKLYDDAIKNGRITAKKYFEDTFFTPPPVNLTSLSDTQFMLLNYYVAYARLEYAHNRNVEFNFYQENGKTFFRTRCRCCEKNQFTNISLERWVENPNDVAIYLNSFMCEYCRDVICNATLKALYSGFGENLKRFMKGHKCALRCCGIELMMFAKHIVDSDFMLIDRNVKFAAEDWEEFETALGDPPIMSRILDQRIIVEYFPDKVNKGFAAEVLLLPNPSSTPFLTGC